MLLVYMTITGNVKDFIERVDMKSHEINPTNPFHEVSEDYIVVVPSYENMITEEVSDFIDYKGNREHLLGFASSGNLNFDDLYCVNAKELSAKYSKPLIFTFEYAGTDKDLENFKKEVNKIAVSPINV
ncbi:class Ib ribonucleoside-diphosphate reductase assembly flavoprotein NrdI [Saliterribacillus persicus]|uniref:Protein involved in ribonucleotide reduction n=1 Tax=Saliterribacillus persicus TaxID=930114 RepID=A0A368X596_9BACI|nr:class Ib ribonucleoside-diphosphate reductase assembly flavoprotein NrdI [Saliterribacillus persicus]RCW63170.1 protein involved in ribonucleotide reduction [Saliterribacillus persicus]